MIFVLTVINNVNNILRTKIIGHYSLLVTLKQFREAIRITQLIPHDHALQHFQKLSSNHEATLELLMDLILKADLSEYQDVLGYLHYCLPSDDQAR